MRRTRRESEVTQCPYNKPTMTFNDDGGDSGGGDGGDADLYFSIF